MDQELQALDSHEDNVAETLSVLQRLIDMKTIYMDATYFDLKNLKEEFEAAPDITYPDAMKRLDSKLEALQKAVSNSTIPSDHLVSNLVKSFSKRMLKMSPTEMKSDTLNISTDSPSSSPLSVNQVKLPKLSIPVFKCDPMKWGVFWEDFQATVHNNHTSMKGRN